MSSWAALCSRVKTVSHCDSDAIFDIPIGIGIGIGLGLGLLLSPLNLVLVLTLGVGLGHTIRTRAYYKD